MSDTAFAGLRSLLFAPANDERKLTKALAGEADAVIADLEDAVAPAEKAGAREALAAALSARRTRIARLVRINGADGGLADDDLAALPLGEVDGIVLPKATPEALSVLPTSGPPVIALIESAAGLRNSYEIAADERVGALMLGAADLGAELRLQARTDGQEILFARSQLVVDSAAAGLPPPIDIVFLDVGDVDGLERECALARSLGFGAKAAIHPRQVPVINRVFSPSAEERDWAQRVIAAYAEGVRAGRGAVTVNDEMVDVAVIARARAILESAEPMSPQRDEATP